MSDVHTSSDAMPVSANAPTNAPTGALTDALTDALTSAPANALAAVAHPDPYPYYEALAACRSFDFDASLGMWIAAGQQAVSAVLRHPACGVRPAGAVVPAALAGGAAGEWFGALVRMNDGPGHAALKSWLQARLATLQPDANALARLRHASRCAWSHAAESLAADASALPARLDDFVFRQPVYALAAWIGVPHDQWRAIHDDVRRLVAAVARAARPTLDDDTIARGHYAASAMQARATRWLDGDAASGSWLHATARGAQRDEAIDFGGLTANIVGLFTQAHDATAGLVANGLRWLARRETRARGPLTSDHAPPPDSFRHAQCAIADVTRFDPPVQNTRRFLHAPAVIGERTIARGESVLVVLASAAPGAAADDSAWTFGRGAHACPGRAPAGTIAAVGVQTVLDSGVDLPAVAAGITYHPLSNIRIARFMPPAD